MKHCFFSGQEINCNIFRHDKLASRHIIQNNHDITILYNFFNFANNTDTMIISLAFSKYLISVVNAKNDGFYQYVSINNFEQRISD